MENEYRCPNIGEIKFIAQERFTLTDIPDGAKVVYRILRGGYDPIVEIRVLDRKSRTPKKFKELRVKGSSVVINIYRLK